MFLKKEIAPFYDPSHFYNSTLETGCVSYFRLGVISSLILYLSIRVG